MSKLTNTDQDWIKSAVYTEPIDSFPVQVDTTAVQVHEHVELPVRRKQPPIVGQRNFTQDATYLDQDDHEFSPQRHRIVKRFKFTSPIFGNNITVTEASKWSPEPVYYAVSREVKIKGPDIVLHKGGSRTGEQVALAQFSTFSRHIKLGFGSEDEAGDSVVWEDMKNTSKYWGGHGRYEFEVDLPDDSDFTWDMDDGSSGTRRKLTWIRTRDECDGIEGWNQRLSFRNYRCVDQSTACVLAVMSAKAFRRCTDKGELKLHEDMSSGLELAILLSALCICEKAERREGYYTRGISRIEFRD